MTTFFFLRAHSDEENKVIKKSIKISEIKYVLGGLNSRVKLNKENWQTCK